MGMWGNVAPYGRYEITSTAVANMPILKPSMKRLNFDQKEHLIMVQVL